MKTSYLLRTLAIILLGWGFLVFGSSSYPVKAQAEDTSTATETETPSPTPDLSNLTVTKSFLLSNDRNHNNIIDSGDGITYTINVENAGTQQVELLLRDPLNLEFFELGFENQPPDCIINGANIECRLKLVGTGKVEYTLTFKDSLDFQGKPSFEVINVVTVLFQETPVATASAHFSVNAPTATPSPTATLTPTATITPSPTITSSPTVTASPTSIPTPVPPPPPSGAPTLQKSPVSIFTVVLLAVIGIAVFTYVGAIAKFGRDPLSDATINNRVAIFREGTIIIFIVSAVLLMGIAGTLQSDAVISILSAIVGYVFGRASAVK